MDPITLIVTALAAGAALGVTDTASAMVTDAYARWKSLPFAGPLFWYSFRDAGTNPGDIEQNFGLLRYDFSPKPSFAAYQAAARAA